MLLEQMLPTSKQQRMAGRRRKTLHSHSKSLCERSAYLFSFVMTRGSLVFWSFHG